MPRPALVSCSALLGSALLRLPQRFRVHDSEAFHDERCLRVSRISNPVAFAFDVAPVHVAPAIESAVALAAPLRVLLSDFIEGKHSDVRRLDDALWIVAAVGHDPEVTRPSGLLPIRLDGDKTL